MKNEWLRSRFRRKSFVTGDWVVWDRSALSDVKLGELINHFGDEPYVVTSMPYRTELFGEDKIDVLVRGGVRMTASYRQLIKQR